MTGVLELYGARTLSNANSETKVQAIALQLYSAVTILLVVAFVNIKVHALYDLQVLLSHLFVFVLTLRRLMSYIYIYIYIWSTHS